VSTSGPHNEMPRILFAASEVMPFAKTGGLADVCRALPAALLTLGVDVRVVMPAYASVREHLERVQRVARTELAGVEIELLETRLDDGLPLWLIANSSLFDRPGTPYHDARGVDFPDNAERFTAFCRALAWLAQGVAGFRPHVVHLNDWPTALAAAFIADQVPRPRTLFAIHNLDYQGLFDRATFDRLQLPRHWWTPAGVEFYDQLSFIKGGLAFADALATVSPTYAREICTPAGGRGLDGLLRHRARQLSGITNGIDTAQWNPAADPYIRHTYDRDTLVHKRANRDALQRELGLDRVTLPLFGVVSRMVEQKGMDLVLAIVDRLVQRPAQLVVLGSGAAELEAGFTAASRRHPGRVAYANRFDEGLAHRIEAGADVFLMPSRFEPCGLNQMYSMRYGTVPIAHRTGGLADTIVAATQPDADGFLFDDASAEALWRAIEEALAAYADPPRWRALQRAGMARDFSWRRSAAAYVDLYTGLAVAAS
jgi:starch synthase